jgi:hypothetical protein
LIVRAAGHREARVFCPEETVRKAYEDPVGTRRQIVADVERIYGALPANDAIDTLVVGADHPMILEARERWEQAHGAT